MDKRVILDTPQLLLTVDRLCYEIFENYHNTESLVLIGIQPRGIHLAERIHKAIENLYQNSIAYGTLDITFYRDDFRTKSKPAQANATSIDFLLEGKQIVIVDDVLYTGRTIRAALDALMDFGRPHSVELLTLIDRRFNRELPIQADYIGKVVDTVEDVEVQVEWSESPQVFFTKNNI
jgi:pyrimidine operon attenuation protein/uracil phosphoribosyltransferase